MFGAPVEVRATWQSLDKENFYPLCQKLETSSLPASCYLYMAIRLKKNFFFNIVGNCSNSKLYIPKSQNCVLALWRCGSFQLSWWGGAGAKWLLSLRPQFAPVVLQAGYPLICVLCLVLRTLECQASDLLMKSYGGLSSQWERNTVKEF